MTETTKVQADDLLFYTPRPNIVMTRGEGVYIYDEQGTEYLDFLAGWAVNALGHCPPVVEQALQIQAATLVNASPAFFNTPMLEYAKLLTKHAGMPRAFFTSTGAEANESAIKLARKYGQQCKSHANKIITTTKSFHGRTLATMAATGKPGWNTMYTPKLEGFEHVPFNDIDAMVEAVNEDTCAVMIELIQGEGGVNIADVEYIQQLKKLCEERQVLFIADEVQTGFGRTGTLFAFEQYGIKPDIMTLGKGIGSGFPLSAMLATEELDIFEPGDQGGTYTGQPLAMAVGHAVLSEIIEKDLCQHAKQMGDIIMTRLSELKQHYPITNIRGKGLMIAFQVPEKRATEIVEMCLQNQLLINAPDAQTLRLVPPLIIDEEAIHQFLKRLTESLKALQLVGPFRH